MKAAESHTNEARHGYYIRTDPTQLKPIKLTQAGNISDIVFRSVPFEEILRFEDRIYIFSPEPRSDFQHFTVNCHQVASVACGYERVLQ